jgi:hypothetical protein
MKRVFLGTALVMGVVLCSPATAQSGASWPGGFAGHLAPAELVWSIVASGQPQHRGLAAEFKLTLIDDGELLVAEDAISGLPIDQTRDEMRANNTSAVIEMPYNFSETAQNDPAGFEDFVDDVASQLERHRVADQTGTRSGQTCSGLRPGAEWTARATDANCERTFVVTYRCEVTELDGRSVGTWLRTESKAQSGAGDLSPYCG